jgi:adenylate kinase
MSGCTLVFGISGVGKTTACRNYVERHPETLFVSASSLLKSRIGMSGEALRTASAGQIVDNQAVLAAALAIFRRGREKQPVLIDAHGVIDNDQGLVPVPVSAIAALAPDRLILLEAPARVVAAHRSASARARPVRSLEAIGVELAAERETVEGFARALEIGLTIAEVTSDFQLDAFIGEQMPWQE